MDWALFLDALGGGPSAVGLLALGYLVYLERQAKNAERERNNTLTDKYLEMALQNNNAMNSMATQLERLVK